MLIVVSWIAIAAYQRTHLPIIAWLGVSTARIDAFMDVLGLNKAQKEGRI
jgi:hypothetical protein